MRDSNHKTVELEFTRRGAKVIDLSNIGGGCPDLLVAYAGRERLVEVKRPARKAGRGLRSTKCATCRHDRKFHPFPDGYCEGCVRKAKAAFPKHIVKCRNFIPDYGELKTPGGVVSNKQRRFVREWPGSEPALARDETDVERILDEMRGRVRPPSETALP